MGCASLPLSYTAGTNLNKGIISFAARFGFAARIESRSLIARELRDALVHPQFFLRRDADALFLLVISLFSLFLALVHPHLSFLDYADALFSCLTSLA